MFFFFGDELFHLFLYCASPLSFDLVHDHFSVHSLYPPKRELAFHCSCTCWLLFKIIKMYFHIFTVTVAKIQMESSIDSALNSWPQSLSHPRLVISDQTVHRRVALSISSFSWHRPPVMSMRQKVEEVQRHQRRGSGSNTFL